MVKKLQDLKECIENMSKYHQVEILRLLTEMPHVCTNENYNGTFINLTEQSDDVIIALEQFTIYVKEQQEQLSLIEDKKILIKETFFKDNKETANIKLS